MEQEFLTQAPPPVGPEQAAEAERILHKYKAGKAALDRRLIDNELWFRMAHWKQYKNRMMEGKPQPSSGWLFNSIASKHADAMDNYPEPCVLPRAADDEATARTLSSILPVVLEQADYEQVYSDSWWRKLKQGTGVKGIFWDPAARGGLGEIAIRSMNLLMLYWEPGIMDIQDSPHFFSLSLEDSEQLAARWPQLRGRTGGTIDAARYIHDDSIDTTDKSVVVDWYYKKPGPGGRELVHYCKFCNGVVLYASENDPRLAERGFYDHGRYPFVFDVLFQEEDSPAGFGYIDVMKDCQNSIDKMNQAMDENVLLASKQRYVLSDAAGINEEELADFSRDIVHVTGRLSSDSFHQMQTAGLQASSITYRNSRVDELKEISGNRDVSQGGTSGGVTAASAIAALQEAGSKLSRDMIKSAYRAFARECYMVIDLMRQFYDEERIFRITGEQGHEPSLRILRRDAEAEGGDSGALRRERDAGYGDFSARRHGRKFYSLPGALRPGHERRLRPAELSAALLDTRGARRRSAHVQLRRRRGVPRRPRKNTRDGGRGYKDDMSDESGKPDRLPLLEGGT